jgi:putative ABC transport system permease protein
VDSIEWSQNGPFMAEIDTAFLGVTGMPLLRGRAFTAADVETAAPVALVNDALARKFWPGQDAIGKCLYVGMKSEPESAVCRQVVGVVSSYRNRLEEDERMQNYYLPLSYRWRQAHGGHALVVRTVAASGPVVPRLYRVLNERLPSSEPDAVMAIGDILDRELAPWKSGTTLFGLFAGLAIVLAVGGLYSVVACSVAQRSHEFGIRIAVGARARNLVTLVLGGALKPVAIGLVIGLGLSLWLVRFLQELLYQTAPRDPLSFGAAAGLILMASTIACLLPARTAMRADPRVALQAD